MGLRPLKNIKKRNKRIKNNKTWRAKKMYRKITHSQNFLKSSKLVNRLISKSSINSKDVVYEIGPGKGIITQELAKKCSQVVAIEADKKLYLKLCQKFGSNNKIKFILDDFLKFKLPGKGVYKIFSNIPFNLTADIVKKLTQAKNPPKDTYLIVQREAALKFAGQPYYKESQYSLLLKPLFELKIVAKLKRTDFRPQPEVNAVLLEIKKGEKPLVEQNQLQLYRDFVIYGFNQWKPTLKESLRKIFTGIQFNRLSNDLNFSRTAKPTDLNIDQWLGLFKLFTEKVPEDKQRLIFGAEKRLQRHQSKLQKVHRTRIKKQP